MNKWIQNGAYYANKGRWPDIAYFPDQELYGTVLVFGNNNWITQLFVNLSGETYIRQEMNMRSGRHGIIYNTNL